MASDGDMLDEEAVEEGVDRRRWESDTARINVSKTSGSVIILTLSFVIILTLRRGEFLGEEEEEEPYLRVKCMCVRSLADLFLYPCTPPTAPVSRSFGLRSSYEIAIFDTD